MEVAGLAIGIAGLAGAFASVVQAVKWVETYGLYFSDADLLHAQLEGHRILLERWGSDIGLDKDAKVEDFRARCNRETFGVAERLLGFALEILESVCAYKRRERGENHDQIQPANKEHAVSRRHRLRWAVSGKEQLSDQVDLFGKIVSQLRLLIPVASQDRKESQPVPPEAEVLGTIQSM
jgi:hypothetical protein